MYPENIPYEGLRTEEASCPPVIAKHVGCRADLFFSASTEFQFVFGLFERQEIC
jgi:hypothetical protein